MKKIFSVNNQNRNIDLALLIARVSIAALMLTHGIPKLFMIGDDPVSFMNFMGLGSTASLGLAVFAEVFCSLLILFGLATRLAVIPLIVTMIVAVFYVHISDPFVKQEMGLHYLVTYIILLILGSGRYSLDALMLNKKGQLL